MRKLLVAVASIIGFTNVGLAADLPALKVAPPLTWNGFYIGASAGGLWGNANLFSTPADPIGVNSLAGRFGVNSGLGGVTGGYNWQLSQFVLGVEGDYSFLRASEVKTDIAPFNTAFTDTVSQRDLATFRGRLGYLIAPNILLYATGGLALTNVDAFSTAPNGATSGQTLSNTGWTAGGGVEWMFTPNFSAKLEYLHAGFSSKNYNYPPVTPVTFVNPKLFKFSDDIVRVGLNWHFQLF